MRQLLIKWNFPCYLFLFVLLAACRESGHKTENPAGHTAAPASHKVSITGMKFVPDTVAIQAGDTLVFTNNDLVPHDVTQFPEKEWTSGVLNPGNSWQFVPAAGDDYFCSIHVIMKGKILVK